MSQKITTFLTFNDQAEQAAALYTSLFKNSKIHATTRYGEGAPMPKGTVMTIELELEGQRYVLLNGGSSFSFSQGISLQVNCANQKEVDHYWNGLLEGGGKPVACGWLVDRFGVSWQITPTILMEMIQDKDPVKAKRAMDAMMKMVKLDIATLIRAYEGGAS